MRLSKNDIPEMAFGAFFGTLIWIIVLSMLGDPRTLGEAILRISLAILGGVALGIALVYDEKLIKEAEA
jgi:hypothetical protein